MGENWNSRARIPTERAINISLFNLYKYQTFSLILASSPVFSLTYSSNTEFHLSD